MDLAISQSGVSEVIYFIEKRLNSDTAYIASHKLLSMAGVKVSLHPQFHSSMITTIFVLLNKPMLNY